MGRHISSKTIDNVSSSVDMVSLVSEYVHLDKKGTNFWGCCPFHNEDTPSLKLYDDHYHCFACGAHGDVINFVADLTGLRTYDAAKQLKRQLFERFLDHSNSI